MAKKRKNKPKPLLSVQGIVHLKNSFIQPSDESGLLSTVGGGKESALVLAPNYGYGVSASSLDSKAAKEDNNGDDKPDEPETSENGETTTVEGEDNEESSKQSPNNNNEDEGKDEDGEELSVAQLVRNIGGGRNVPLSRRDVFEDRNIPAEAEKDEEAEPMDEKTKAETDEFYASIGRPNPLPDKTTSEQSPAITAGDSSSNSQDVPASDITPENQADSIRDYYKTYCKYYYSATPDPLGDKPLEFSSTIDPSSDSNIDESVFELARMAQKARRAMDATIAAKRQTELQKLQEAKNKEQRDNDAYDPLPMEIVQNEYEVMTVDTMTTLTQYWDYVKENPHDFNRWTYLIHYVETINNLIECRKAYSAFLPLFPYCFGYWKRYAEIERAHHYYNRSLLILQRGLEFTPLSVDLCLAYLNLFCEIHAHDNNFQELVREQFDKILRTVGMEFRSDAFWEAYIQWEQCRSNLRNMFAIYRKLIQVPTRLYNRHCDNVRVLVRDHHPRDFLSRAEYERLRKKGCKLLKFKYKEEPELEIGEIRKTSKPEDKLMAYVKDVILEKITVAHDKTEVEVTKRWVFEDKIKRPYFHVKALDMRQLKNWDEYLNFEIRQGNHDRIVLLFERCITACAHYESYWCKYARYLENYHRKNTKEISVHMQKSQINVELVSRKETEEEEALIAAAMSVVEKMISEIESIELREREANESHISLVSAAVIENIISAIECSEKCTSEGNELQVVSVSTGDQWQSSSDEVIVLNESSQVNIASSTSDDQQTENEIRVPPAILDGDLSAGDGSPPKSGELDTNENSSSGFTSLLSVPSFPPARFHWQEVVRDIYKRGSIVHCPRKPTLRLQWAAFEEELGNKVEAKQLIQHVLEWFPDLLEAKLQLLEFERRNGNQDDVLKLYDEYLKSYSSFKSKNASSILSLKYARYLFKELGRADKALLVLRKAVTKDKGNVRLYRAVYNLCYERVPADRKGALAALELAIQSKQLSDEDKLTFHKLKVLYLQEHGDLGKYRDAIDKLNECQEIVDKVKEEEQRAMAFDVPSQYEAAAKPADNVFLQPFPVPTVATVASTNSQQPVPINFEREQENKPSPSPEEAVAGDGQEYKNVPPTRELLVTADYGYSYKHPEKKLIDNFAQKEYESLESKGYPEHIKDKEGEATSSKKRKAETPLYIVAPRGSYLMSYLGGPNTGDNPPVPGGSVYLEGAGSKRMKLEAPMEMSRLILPTNAPCINVPDWFVKEGGELCISETTKGYSILRYWPHFLTESGYKKMFKCIRKGVKWHQKQICVYDRWRPIPRLISWLGPCDYSHNGMVIEKNESWPPELLDLLHRLINLSHYEFNSCSLNLYRSGHDSNGWHSDSHQALGSNPPVASISLGAIRYFELRKKGYEQNFLRFPLFPGSLLLMEGATQEDWVHQVPKDPTVKEERINLTFRVMHAIETLETPKDSDTSKTTTNTASTASEAASKATDTTVKPASPQIGPQKPSKESKKLASTVHVVANKKASEPEQKSTTTSVFSTSSKEKAPIEKSATKISFREKQ